MTSFGETKSQVQPFYIKPAQQEVQKSISTEEIIGSIHGQLLLLPAFQGFPTLNQIKEYNRATSYDRLTAAGCLQRMAKGDWHESLLTALITSLYQAQKQDKLRWGKTQQLWQEAPPSLRPCLDNFMRWLTLTEEHLKQAMVLTEQVVGAEYWIQLIPSTSFSKE